MQRLLRSFQSTSSALAGPILRRHESTCLNIFSAETVSSYIDNFQCLPGRLNEILKEVHIKFKVRRKADYQTAMALQIEICGSSQSSNHTVVLATLRMVSAMSEMPDGEAQVADMAAGSSTDCKGTDR